MIDYFALLQQPRKPWLETETLKEKYHELARAAQPGQELNEAYRVLVDPKLRLQHLLALEGGPPSSASEQVPEELADLFMQIAPALNKIDMQQARRLDDSIGRVKQLSEGTLEELRELDANWKEQLPQIEKIYQRISYLTRWLALLEERRFQLHAAP
jgi:DnaJ-domain-containing protein 1